MGNILRRNGGMLVADDLPASLEFAQGGANIRCREISGRGFRGKYSVEFSKLQPSIKKCILLKTMKRFRHPLREAQPFPDSGQSDFRIISQKLLISRAIKSFKRLRQQVY